MKCNVLFKRFITGLLIISVQLPSIIVISTSSSSITQPLNLPPHIPSNPNPPHQATSINIVIDLFWVGGDPDGDPVTYDIYFGTTTSPMRVVKNQSIPSYDPGTLAYSTTYYWKIVAWDNHNLSSPGPIWSFTTMDVANNPPNKPSKPLGIINVKINTEYSYISGTYDPNGDTVYYLWDWGDGNTSGWIGPYSSGALCVGTHTWNSLQNYTVKVKAKDLYGKESEWSDPLPITIPHISCLLHQMFNGFFQRFSCALSLLRYWIRP